MTADFHRPVRRSSFNLPGKGDPAEQARAAHATAPALLARVRSDDSGVSAERLISFIDEHGIDEIAELWADAPARSLPGVLWRLYLLHSSIHG